LKKETMKKGEFLYEEKVGKIFRTDDPTLLAQRFKGEFTA